MQDFNIAKFLKENKLGSHGIFNNYIDLQPLKEEEEEMRSDVPNSTHLTGNGDGDSYQQTETLPEADNDFTSAAKQRMNKTLDKGYLDANAKERIDGLIDQNDLFKFTDSVQSIYLDLVNEGFDKQDINEYLKMVIDEIHQAQ